MKKMRLYTVFSLLSLFLFICSTSSERRHYCPAYSDNSSVASIDTTKYFNFNVGYKDVRHLNTTKRIVATDMKFPGPTIYANGGDRLIIKVTNYIDEDVAIHWHGVRQFLSCWVDGTPYITQCSVRPGQSFTHNFTVNGQIGTLLWHAHISWLHATLHAAIVIFPRPGVRYPYSPHPNYYVPTILGEWWNKNTQIIENMALMSGGAPNVSDAATINGYPGPLYKKSEHSVFLFQL